MHPARLFASIRSRFGRRLLVLYVVCSLFPTAILAYLSLGAVSRQLERQGVDRLQQAGRILEDAVASRAALLADDLAQISADAAPCRGAVPRPGDPVCDGSLLYGLSALTGVPAGRGPTVLFGDAVPVPSLTDVDRADLASGRSLLLNEGAGPRGSVEMVTRTKAGGLLIGRVLGAYLWAAREEAPSAPSMLFQVIDDSLRLVSTDDEDGRGPYPAAAGRRVRRGTSRPLEWSSGDTKYLAVAAPFRPTPDVAARRWTMVVSDTRAAVLAPIAEFQRYFLLAVSLGIGIAILLALSQLQRSLGPLRALQVGTRQLAERTLDRPVVVTSDDEFAELASSFNTMSDRIGRQFAAEKAAAAIDRAILSSVETTEIVGATLRGIRETCGRDAVAIALFDPTNTIPPATFLLDRSGGLVAGPGVAWTEPPAPDERELTTVAAHEAPGWVPAPLLAGAAEIVVLPLRYQGGYSGAIGIALPPDGALVADTGPRLVGIARQATLALANARMIEEIRRLAFFDNLTGLPNRVSFKRLLSEELTGLAPGDSLAVFFLDLDHFSRINDTHGHKVGDRLIQEVADRVAHCCRAEAPGAAVARLGGDEFTVVLPEPAGSARAAALAETILDAFRAPFALEGHDTFVSASIGIAVAPADGADLEALLKNADSAMYHAKRLGRGRFAFYATSLGATVAKRLRVENQLRKALDAGEFAVWYQPIADVATGRIASAEALVRWEHPEWGMVSPGDFIPICEESGLIVPLGEWVLNAVCRQIKDWEAAGVPVVPVAVNLSSRQVLSGGIVETVRRAIKTSGVHPRHLGLELTESVLMEGAADTLETLHALAALGLSLAIDDFGTGYSSLSYLKQFPAHAVKIDRSFIRDVIVNPGDAAITSAIVAMGKALNLRIIAEGVEQVEQMELLRRLGCDRAQGFLVGRPAPAEVFVQCLGRNRLTFEIAPATRPGAATPAPRVEGAPAAG